MLTESVDTVAVQGVYIFSIRSSFSKKLYKNSGREQGTLRYFREKLQRRNVTIDVKHYEDCEQFFLTVGKSFTMEALLHFFGMETKDSSINQNRPPYCILEVGHQ